MNPLDFMLLGIEEVRPDDDDDAKYRTPATMIMYGRMLDGTSISVRVDSFRPYFWFCPPLSTGAESIRRTLNKLEKKFHDMSVTKTRLKRSLYTRFAEPFLAHRLEFLNMMQLYGARKALQPAESLLYEQTGISLPLRFMIDMKIVPCGWIRVRPSCWQPSDVPDTPCTRNIALTESHGRALRALSGDTGSPQSLEPSLTDEVAPLRTLWFDIECVDERGMFPHYEHAQVVMISCVAVVGAEVHERTLLHLRSCAAFSAEVRMIECSSERALLERFGRLVEQFDADIVGGYNSGGFDFPFIMQRAEHLKTWAMQRALSRNLTRRATLEKSVFESSAHGKRESFTVNMHGRVHFDLLEWIRREYKMLRTYTLNAVSQHFLQDTKDDVHHSMIPKLFEGTDEERARLARYCMKDSELLHELSTKLLCMPRLVEMARVTGVDFITLLERGQQIKVVSQLARQCREDNLLLPLKRNTTGYAPEGKFDGATVLEPKTGYYRPDQPVMVLDFKSLYPSEQCAHNLSYDTLIPPEKVHEYAKDEYERSPVGHCFAREPKGVLPRLLKLLLDRRAAAKREMKREKDPFRAQVMNARQLALKISANSVYGFTGIATNSGGSLPLFECSEATTAYGRQDLQATADYIKARYDDVHIVYGDTDSVFIQRDSLRTVRDAWLFMDELGKRITQELFGTKRPMELEAEKVYGGFVSVNKKRYVGYVYKSVPDEGVPEMGNGDMDYAGVETVRRDTCPLVSSTIQRACEFIFAQRDIERGVQCIKDVVRDLYTHRVPFDQLIITRSLSQEPDQYLQKQPHAELVTLMRRRDAGSAPRIGDRVVYIMTNKGDQKRSSEMAEDPLYMLENNMTPNVQYYLEKQLRKPIERILAPIVGDAAISDIFCGEHTRRKVQRGSTKRGGIMSFMTVQRRCIVCSAVQARSVCNECRKRKAECVRDEREAAEQRERDARAEFDEVYASCQRCQGHQGEVLCMARDCAQLYKRKDREKKLERAVKDIEDLLK